MACLALAHSFQWGKFTANDKLTVDIFRPQGRIVGSAPGYFPTSVMVRIVSNRVSVRAKVSVSVNRVRVR